ncbi:MAG: ABC transporter permease subunit [Nitrososphaerota archaeon]
MDLAMIFTILSAIGYSWLRMTVGLSISLLFSFAVGIAAATSRTLEKIIIPVLDILQSIPILSFFPIALYAFISLHPVIGPELAAVFLIFTSQVWNISFGVYEAIKFIPTETLEVTNFLRFSIVDKIQHLYIRASFPKVAANLPSSWANGLYFLVACEIITIGEAEYRLYGIGSITTQLIASGMVLESVLALCLVMFFVVLMNLLVFIPMIRISMKYRFEAYAVEVPHAWFERVIKPFTIPIKMIAHKPRFAEHWKIGLGLRSFISLITRHRRYVETLILLTILAILMLTVRCEDVIKFSHLVFNGLSRLGYIEPLIMLGYSLARVSTVTLITLGWTIPVSIILYENKTLEKILTPIFQAIASFPATLLIPFIMDFNVKIGLMKEFGALIIILLGTTWYMLFSLRGALSLMPSEEEELFKLLRIRGLKKLWHLYLPRMTPSMITGCIITVGGGWNTLVIAERTVLDHLVWEVENPGIGKTMNVATSTGDIQLLVATTIWMALFIVLINRLVWRRIYEIAVRRIV